MASGEPRDVIAIEALRVDCVVGVYPHEREAPQPLEIDVELTLDTTRAGTSQRLRRTVDYAAVASQIAFLLQHARFHLLETAAHALLRFLLAPPSLGEERARVASATLRLVKPQALGGNGVPSLEVHRDAAGVRLEREEKPWGTVDIVFTMRELGIYRLNVAPGAAIPLHVHRVMSEAEMTLGDGLVLNGTPVAAGVVHRWPHGAAHRWQNPTDRWQSILCIDSPAFLPTDEVEVEGLPAAVAPERPFLPAPPPGAASA